MSSQKDFYDTERIAQRAETRALDALEAKTLPALDLLTNRTSLALRISIIAAIVAIPLATVPFLLRAPPAPGPTLRDEAVQLEVQRMQLVELKAEVSSLAAEVRRLQGAMPAATARQVGPDGGPANVKP